MVRTTIPARVGKTAYFIRAVGSRGSWVPIEHTRSRRPGYCGAASSADWVMITWRRRSSPAAEGRPRQRVERSR